MEYMEARTQDRYEALSEISTQTPDTRPIVAEQQGGGERTREEVIVAISEELKKHEAFDGKIMAQLVWATRIYDGVIRPTAAP